MNNMNPFKRIPIFLSLCLALVVGVTTTQAQFSSGAPTKLVLIDSFNDIASVQPAQNTKSVVVIRYGNTEGDQKGGSFMYDSTSTASGDGLNVFVPASGVGRWLRYDNAVYVSGSQTASRVIVSDGSGDVGTDADLTFDGSNLTVGGNVTVSGLATGSTDTVVTASGADLLQTRTINPDVWNLGADLDNSGVSTAAGTRLIGPSIFMDGTDDYIEIADSDILSFQTAEGSNQGVWSAATNTPFLTDGTGTLDNYYIVTAAGSQNLGSGSITYAVGDIVKYDGSIWYQEDKSDLSLTIAGWINLKDATSGTILAKFGSGATTREWRLYLDSSDLLTFRVDDIAGSYEGVYANTALTANQDTWIHIAATYGGSGNSTTPFSDASSEMTLYVSGTSVALTEISGGSYAGMANTTEPVAVGRRNSTDYFEGHIRDLRIFNRELSATEVALVMNSDLGFSFESGEGFGDSYYSDFRSGTDSMVDINGTGAGNITVGGEIDSYRHTVDNTSNSHGFYQPSVLTNGKTHTLSFEYYVPSGQSNVDGIELRAGASGAYTITTISSPTTDAWTAVDVEFIPVSTGNSDRLYFYALDGGSITFQDAGGDDVFYVKHVFCTQVGTVADLRAENYDETTGKLYDFSSNAFVGVNSGGTLVGRSYPYYEVGTWTPAITFGGGSTGLTYTTQEGHYTREGNWVSVHAYIVLSAKGSSTGTALVTSLPFTARNTTGSSQSLVVGNMANGAALTSAPTAYATDNGTTINLVDWGATGSAVLDDTNFTNTSAISITGSFQVQ